MASILILESADGQKKSKPKPQSKSLSKADEKFLLDSQRQMIRVFRQVARGKTARMLDDTFENFDLPRIAKRRRWLSSPSSVVLASDVTIIKYSELERYEAVLAMAKKHSQALRDLDMLMKRCNRRIRRILKQTGLIHRGMAITELEIIAGYGGIFGLHPRKMYAAESNFVSCSIDTRVAMLYATLWDELGLYVEIDVSGMDESEYVAPSYEARNGIKVTDGGRHVYNPYEKFGGSRTGMTLYQYEIHLLVGSRPVIRAVTVMGGRSARFKRRLERAVACLERTQKQKITIKYLFDRV